MKWETGTTYEFQESVSETQTEKLLLGVELLLRLPHSEDQQMGYPKE